MTTTIRQLIDVLEQIAEASGDDTQILCAHQPNYPLAEMLACVVETRVGSHGELLGDTENCVDCDAEGCDLIGDIADDDGAMFCTAHAEEAGIDIHGALDESTPVAWLLLGGHPSEYSDSAWKSPYASSSLWDESVGESYNLN